jgi:hypothetical protein
MTMSALAYQLDDDADEVSARYKSVCYRCRYVGLPGSATRCPLCEFPLILVAATASEEDETSVERILDRADVNAGAPPLPGVDGTPRKAQLLAEARKQRRSAEVRAATPPVAVVADAIAAPRSKRSFRATGSGVTLHDAGDLDLDVVPSLRPLSTRIGGFVLGTLLLAGAAAAGLAAAMV